MAQKRLSELPRGAHLSGMARPLTDGERLALSYLDAALTVLGSKGIDASSFTLDVETPDSEALE